jgi:hypothetical protein
MQVSVIAQIASHLCEYSHSAAKSVRHSANSFPFLHFIPIKNREPSVPSEHHRGAQRQLRPSAIVLVITHHHGEA